MKKVKAEEVESGNFLKTSTTFLEVIKVRRNKNTVSITYNDHGKEVTGQCPLRMKCKRFTQIGTKKNEIYLDDIPYEFLMGHAICDYMLHDKKADEKN